MKETVAGLEEEEAALAVEVVGGDAEDAQALPLPQEFLFPGVDPMVRRGLGTHWAGPGVGRNTGISSWRLQHPGHRVAQTGRAAGLTCSCNLLTPHQIALGHTRPSSAPRATLHPTDPRPPSLVTASSCESIRAEATHHQPFMLLAWVGVGQIPRLTTGRAGR